MILIKNFAIPTDVNLVAIDGSHRIAAGITNFSKVRVAQFDYEDVMEVNFEFFKRDKSRACSCHPLSWMKEL